MIVGVGHVEEQHGHAQHADRQVDQEHPAPVEALGQLAAQRRPDDRGDHDAHAVDGHRLADALLGIDVEQHGLRQRRDDGAADALQDAEQHHLGRLVAMPQSAEATVKPMTEIRNSRFCPMRSRHPAGERRRDGGGDDVGGQHPGDLVLRGAAATPPCAAARRWRWWCRAPA